MQSLLVKYEEALGHCTNSEKIAMVFSRNTPTHIRYEVIALWSNGTLQQYEKYLGLPFIIGRAKRKALLEINDRVWKMLQTWKESTLSQGGKEVLIKVVALSIPSFAMSCFMLLESLCNELEGIMAQF